MKKIVYSAGMVFMLSGPVFAQQTLLGKYSGSFVQTSQRGDLSTGITLEILSVDGDSVAGKAIRAPRAGGGRSTCHGEYPVEGKVKGDTLELRGTEKGIKAIGAGDCQMTLRLTVDGNKLVGTINNSKAQLSK